MTDTLWTPERKPLWTPFKGRVRLQVGWPDNPDNPGEETDTGWENNTVLPYLPYMLWSALNPFDSDPWTRYLDGTLVYPSWGDVFAGYLLTAVTGGGASGTGTTISGTTAGTSPVAGAAGGVGNASTLNAMMKWLMNALVIGNYNTAAPTGNNSTVTSANWTTYSLIRRYMSDVATPSSGAEMLGFASAVYFGPAISSSSITGVGPPNASTTVTRTFTAQAGTVNAIAFAPNVWNHSGAASTGLSTTGNTLEPNLLKAVAGGAGTALSMSSFEATLAASGEPFPATVNIILSTLYLASAAVTIATGAQLTMSYQLSVTL